MKRFFQNTLTQRSVHNHNRKLSDLEPHFPTGQTQTDTDGHSNSLLDPDPSIPALPWRALCPPPTSQSRKPKITTPPPSRSCSRKPASSVKFVSKKVICPCVSYWQTSQNHHLVQGNQNRVVFPHLKDLPVFVHLGVTFFRGTWVAQLVKHLTPRFGSGHDLVVL